jgi:hypothetical protein
MPLVVIVFRDALMPATPAGPGHHVARALLERQDQAPQEPPNLLDSQREVSPRVALNAARLLLPWRDGRLFLNASTAMAPARKTTNRAKAHMASVICRYQPVQLRTS